MRRVNKVIHSYYKSTQKHFYYLNRASCFAFVVLGILLSARALVYLTHLQNIDIVSISYRN